TAASIAMGATKDHFFQLVKRENSSTSWAESSGGAFHMTLDQNFARTHSVAKLPRIITKTVRKFPPTNPPSNKRIFGQNPESGGTPMTEKITRAINSEIRGYCS